MQFIIRAVDKLFPHPPLEPRGSELVGYFPKGAAVKQLNYGQGEGQVEISGCEWGIYQTNNRDELALVVHSGEISAMDAVAVVRQVAECTCGEARFAMLIRGTADRISDNEARNS
jgi:hypothetical protein